MLENHDLGKRHKIWAKLHCLPKFFWAGTPMVIYYAFCYLLKFNLMILLEERMNFKLNNIPGNSIYIEIDKMNDDILAQIVLDLISDTAKFSLQFDETTNASNLSQLTVFVRYGNKEDVKKEIFYFVSPL